MYQVKKQHHLSMEMMEDSKLWDYGNLLEDFHSP